MNDYSTLGDYRNSKKWFLALALAASWGFTGCASPPQSSQPATYRAQSGNLAQAMGGARTFSFHPRAKIVRPLSDRGPVLLQSEIETAITSVLSDRGISLQGEEEGPADRIIAYAIGASGELGDAELAEIFGISAGLDLDSKATRGGIVLAVLDPRRGVVLWRTSGSARTDRKESRTRTQPEQIEHAVKILLEGLPAR